MDDFEGLYGLSAAVAATPPPTKKRPAGPNPGGTSSKVPKQDAATKTPIGSAYERRNPGQVEVQFFDGVNDDKNDGQGDTAPKVQLLEHFKHVGPCRYMRDTLEGKAEELEAKLQLMEQSMIAQHNIADVSAVGVPSQEEATVVGRVCCEAEGKLNSLSVVLEGGIHSSGAARVKLDVQDVKQYSLFPGQLIAAKGINTTGAKFQASQLYQGSIPSGSSECQEEITRAPVVWAACGPFTASGDLEFDALSDLMDQCQASQPDVLVLMGPFLGANHPLLKQPPIDKTFAQLLQEKIGSILDQNLEDELKTNIVLIPSTQDLCHNHIVFPQPPFEQQDLGLESPQSKAKILCFPNPAMFTVSGVTFGASSCDIIKDLSVEEISSKQQPGVGGPSRIVRITNHLLQQQSFYPLFPARAGSCVDYQTAKKFDIPVKPDVLILSSDLQRFVEKIEGDVVCCNPGRLVRGGVSGTYLRCKYGKEGSAIDIVRL